VVYLAADGMLLDGLEFLSPLGGYVLYCFQLKFMNDSIKNMIITLTKNIKYDYENIRRKEEFLIGKYFLFSHSILPLLIPTIGLK